MYPSSALIFYLAVSFTLAVECLYLKLDRDISTISANNQHASRSPVEGKKGVMLMNRIAPSQSILYISNVDGTNERQLLSTTTTFDYHASFSPDGQWITFTSEREGDGNSDLYRVHPDGSGLEKILATSSFEDGLVLSPDGSKVAYVSTANGYVANVWVMDMVNGTGSNARNLTNTDAVKGVSWSPNSYFAPAWSPDGEWIAFSSDRNTNWTGHGNGTGWEHTQELSVYVIRPNGTDFRQVVKKEGYSLGSPKWSPDGSHIVFYEIEREYTWNAHRPEDLDTTDSQIVSVDFTTGLDRKEETSGAGLKLQPSYVDSSNIGYLVKGPIADQGIYYTSNISSILGAQRSPAWSPDGSQVIYEKVDWTVRPYEKKLYSWSDEWEYSSIVTMNPNGTDIFEPFDTFRTGQVDASLNVQGLAGAFQPSWSPDGEWLAFGLGDWFFARSTGPGWIYRATANGTYHERLTDNSTNSGFPSYSHDGTKLVYRAWGSTLGLRVLDLITNTTTTLTTEPDNLPFFSPDGTRIVFTRHMNATNYDICTISPDGTDLQVLTSSGANDAHAVWTADGRIMWSSGMYGFRAEAALYDDTFQPYGQIFVMEADGSGKRILTDSMWEDSMPLFLPNEVLG